jgi:hypothetical protein
MSHPPATPHNPPAHMYWLFVIGVKSVLLLALIIAAVVWYVSDARAEEQIWNTDERAAVETLVRGAYVDKNYLVSKLLPVKIGDRNYNAYVTYSDWTGKDMYVVCNLKVDASAHYNLTCGSPVPASK